MILFQILTPWKVVSDMDGDFLDSSLADEYNLLSWTDVTGQPIQNLIPDPNLYAIQVKAADDVFAAIQSDPAYLVLWSKMVK